MWNLLKDFLQLFLGSPFAHDGYNQKELRELDVTIAVDVVQGEDVGLQLCLCVFNY